MLRTISWGIIVPEFPALHLISIKSILIRLSTLENHSLYRNSCKIIGFINLVDDVNWPIYLSNTFDKTKLFCIILHQSSTVCRAETAYGVNEAFSTSNSRLAHWRFFAVSCCLNILSGSICLWGCIWVTNSRNRKKPHSASTRIPQQL